MNNTAIPLESRGDVFYTLCKALGSCASGLNLHIQDAAITLNGRDSVDWWLAELRTILYRKYGDHHNRLLGISEINTAHTHIAFAQEAMKKGRNLLFDTTSMVDYFVVVAAIEKEDLAASDAFFCKHYTPDEIIVYIKSHLQERIGLLSVKHDIKFKKGWFNYHYGFVEEFNRYLKTLGIKQLGGHSLQTLTAYSANILEDGATHLKIRLNTILRTLIYNNKIFAIYPNWDACSMIEAAAAIGGIVNVYSIDTLKTLIRHHLIPNRVLQWLTRDGSFLGKVLLHISDRTQWLSLVAVFFDLDQLGQARASVDVQYPEQIKLLKEFPASDWYQVDKLLYRGLTLVNAVIKSDLAVVKQFYELGAQEVFSQKANLLLSKAIEHHHAKLIVYLLSTSAKMRAEIFVIAARSPLLAKQLLQSDALKEIAYAAQEYADNLDEADKQNSFILAFKEFCARIQLVQPDALVKKLAEERLQAVMVKYHESHVSQLIAKYNLLRKLDIQPMSLHLPPLLKSIDDVLIAAIKKRNFTDVHDALLYGAKNLNEALRVALAEEALPIIDLLLARGANADEVLYPVSALVPAEKKKQMKALTTAEQSPINPGMVDELAVKFSELRHIKVRSAATQDEKARSRFSGWKKTDILAPSMFNSVARGCLEYVSQRPDAIIYSIKIKESAFFPDRAEVILLCHPSSEKRTRFCAFLDKYDYVIPDWNLPSSYTLQLPNVHALKSFLAHLCILEPSLAEIESAIVAAAAIYQQVNDSNHTQPDRHAPAKDSRG